jgi:hypothetical protein
MTTPPPASAPHRRIPWGWLVAFAVIYLLTVMPVGLWLYTLKMDANLNLLQRGGFHAYLQCLEAAAGGPLPHALRLEPTAPSPSNAATPPVR